MKETYKKNKKVLSTTSTIREQSID